MLTRYSPNTRLDLTMAGSAGILGRMITELHLNRNWWWLPQKEWAAG